MKKLAAFLFALILMLCACVQEEPSEIPENGAEISQGDMETDASQEEPVENESVPVSLTDELLKILWTSEYPAKEMADRGYSYYGTEECAGYGNLLSFAEKYSENKDEVFYMADIGTTYKLYLIAYSENEESWVCTEYWMNNNERREREYAIFEIKTYDNRVSFHFENGDKKVIYEKGSELGLPSNNCSHYWQSHYIDIEIIDYINSEDFAEKYSANHSEQYLNFDKYTDTLYSEEEECLINIYHYIEYYGLTYEDFIVAYGSEERIEEVWGETDIKGFFEK